MSNLNNINRDIIRENNGSIDYAYYDSQARNIRSKSILNLLIRVFTGNNNSSKDSFEEQNVLTFNDSKEKVEQLDQLDQAA